MAQETIQGGERRSERWARVNFPNKFVHPHEYTARDGRVFDKMFVSIPPGVSSIGSCSTAMSMFVIGGILSDVDRQQLFDKEICLYSFYRLILIPVMIMIILRLLHLDILSSNVCILLSAMPAASTTAMLAQKYNQNAEFASRMVFISTLFSLITLPIMTLLFQWG